MERIDIEKIMYKNNDGKTEVELKIKGEKITCNINGRCSEMLSDFCYYLNKNNIPCVIEDFKPLIDGKGTVDKHLFNVGVYCDDKNFIEKLKKFIPLWKVNNHKKTVGKCIRYSRKEIKDGWYLKENHQKLMEYKKTGKYKLIFPSMFMEIKHY